MITQKRTGSALLIAVLLMSVLILITIGLSRLVSSETRQIGEMIRNGSAEYLAEGGTELGQLIFYNIQEGSESQFDGLYSFELNNDDKPSQKIQFAIQGTTNHIPIQQQSLFQAYEKTPTDQLKQQLFQQLLPGESTEIFINDQSKEDGFEVEYYLPNLNETDLGNFTQGDLDVLLFKISGEQLEKDNYTIDFVTEYFPAGGPVGTSINTGKSANLPAKISTTLNNGFSIGNFFKYSDGESTASEPNVNCDTTAEGVNCDIKLREDAVQETRSFNEFLNSHNKNVISLTNAVNLSQINTPTGNIDYSRYNELLENVGSIYFRVCSPTCKIAETTNAKDEIQTSKQLVSPFVLIQSQGIFANNTTKNLNTQLTRPNALSVFDFAIYRTDSTGS